jgi:hypothetical protein
LNATQTIGAQSIHIDLRYIVLERGIRCITRDFGSAEHGVMISFVGYYGEPKHPKSQRSLRVLAAAPSTPSYHARAYRTLTIKRLFGSPSAGKVGNIQLAQGPLEEDR